MRRYTAIVSEELAGELSARGDLSSATRESLERYLYLLLEGRRILSGYFESQELALLADLFNGTIFQPWSIAVLHLMGSEISPELAEKWGVDRRELGIKLGRLLTLERFALADAIERHWVRVGRGEPADPGKLLG